MTDLHGEGYERNRMARQAEAMELEAELAREREDARPAYDPDDTSTHCTEGGCDQCARDAAEAACACIECGTPLDAEGDCSNRDCELYAGSMDEGGFSRDAAWDSEARLRDMEGWGNYEGPHHWP